MTVRGRSFALVVALVASLCPPAGGARPARAAQQESSDDVTYAWRRVEASSARGGSYRVERAGGARATLRFSGSSVAWYTRKGPNQGKARILIDGDVVRTVNNYADTFDPQVTRRVTGLSGGVHRLRIEVLGVRGAPGGGADVVVDGFAVGGQQVSTSDATFRWAPVHDDLAAGDRYVRSALGGAHATFRFSGKGVDFYAIHGPSGGRARISIDGEERDVIDTYAPVRTRALAFSIAGLTDEAHTLRVTVLGTKREASGGTRVGVDSFAVRRPSIAVFRELGAWVDLYDYFFADNVTPGPAIAEMAAHGVRTLYIQTGRYNTERGIAAPTKVGNWIESAHAAGIDVVGWYLPAYDQHLDKDVRRTVAIADYVSDEGERFDALAVDIEFKGATESLDEFNDGIRAHLRRVRNRVGNRYSVGGITPAPVAMPLCPSCWTGFPWGAVGRYSDVVMPMAYWTFRIESGQCPDDPFYCAYNYTRENVERSRNKTGLPVHVIGGVGEYDNGTRHVGSGQAQDFVDGAFNEHAIGASLYDYATTHDGIWDELEQLNGL